MNEQDTTYDLLGVGMGPFNLSLAALASNVNSINTLFFEKNKQFDWHPGLLLANANLQVPFLADLVTLADPTHPFSFLNYLHQHQRMYKFYFRENFHISRQEYNHYCQWVAAQLPNLHFNHRVTNVDLDKKDNASLLRVTVQDTHNQKEMDFYTHHLVVGIGSEPYIPEKLRAIQSPYLQHSAHFLHYKNRLQSENAICVVGSGQSAAEIILELLNEFDRHPRQLTWITRSRGFFPMEYSKLGLEHFSPDYSEYFYRLDEDVRTKTLSQQELMYKGISQQTIGHIFDKVYQLTIANNAQPLTLLAHSELESIHESDPSCDSRFTLHFHHKQLKKQFDMNCDAVIFATGYRSSNPLFLQPLMDNLIIDERQHFALNKDSSIKTKKAMPNKIYMQNNSLFSHGVGSSDLGLVCHRNSLILNNIVGKTCYHVQEKNVFQGFNLPSSIQDKLYENNHC